MNCFQCREPLKPGAKFCNECGAKQVVSCPSCGKPLQQGEKLCQACISQQPPQPVQAVAQPPVPGGQASPLEFTPILPKSQEAFVAAPPPTLQTTQALPLIKDLPPLHVGGLGEQTAALFGQESLDGIGELHKGGLGPVSHTAPRPVQLVQAVEAQPIQGQPVYPPQAQPPVSHSQPEVHEAMDAPTMKLPQIPNSATEQPLHQGSLGNDNGMMDHQTTALPLVSAATAQRNEGMMDACTEGDAKNRGFTFELIERGYRITRFNGRSHTPQIPAFIERVPVVDLHREAFEAKGVNYVGIPPTVTDIGDWCFTDNSISKLELPESIRYVGLCAFKGNRIASMNIPRGLKKIDEEAFECNKLSQIVLPQMLEYVGKSAFSYNNLTNVVIPGSVTFIGKNAFSYNQLNSVIISPGVAYIGENSFAYNQLSSISIPYGVTEISDGAFYMNKLSKIIIPSSVHTIGANAFRSNQLTTVGIPQSVLNIHPQAFDKWVEIVKI